MDRMLAVELHSGQVEVAETVTAVEVPGNLDRVGVGRRRPEPGETGRIEERDEGLHVRRRLRGGHASPRGGDGEDVEAGVEQRQRQGHGIVDPGVDVEDQLAGQGSIPDWK